MNLIHWKILDISKEYPQSMFWIKNKKKRYTPVNPSFIKVGFKEVFITRTCFPDVYGCNISDELTMFISEQNAFLCAKLESSSRRQQSVEL